MIKATDLSFLFPDVNPDHFFLIAGPCAIESKDLTFHIAGRLKEMCGELNIPFIFKGSYRKANRSRLDSFTGIGDEKSPCHFK